MAIRDILQAAFEQIGELSSGESLDGEQIDQGLARLNRILADMPQYGVGARLKDVAVSTDTCGEANRRYIVSGVANITFPDMPGDGARIQIITTTTNAVWMYRSDLGDWVLIGSSEIDDDSPFPIEFDDTLASLLASRLAPLAQASLSAEAKANLAVGLAHMKARYFQRQCVPTDLALLRMSRQPYQSRVWPGDFPC